MPTAASAATEPDAITDLNDFVRVRDLPDYHQNPNVARSVFLEEVSAARVSEDEYISYVDGQSQPGKGFATKSISVKAVQMKTSFDANGDSGSAGDWLVYFNGHYMVVRDDSIMK